MKNWCEMPWCKALTHVTSGIYSSFYHKHFLSSFMSLSAPSTSSSGCISQTAGINIPMISYLFMAPCMFDMNSEKLFAKYNKSFTTVMHIILPVIMTECFPLHAVSHFFFQNLHKEILWPVSSVITSFKVEINSGPLAGLIKLHFVGRKCSGVQSGWQRSRKQSSPLSTKILKIHLQVKQFTLYSYRQWHKMSDIWKRQENVHIAGWAKVKRKRRNQGRPCTPGRELWRRNLSHSMEVFSLAGESV